MNRHLLFFFLVALTPINCAFDWGFGAKDSCIEGKKIAGNLGEITGVDEREKAEKRVLQLCGEGAAGHFVAGLRRERSGDSDGAVKQYREALQRDPAFPEASGNLGLLYLQNGLYDDAAVELTKAMRFRPEPRYDRGLALIFASKKLYSLALYHYAEALKAYPDDVPLRTGFAEASLKSGDVETAEQEYGKALAAEPANLGARLGLAALLLGKNEPGRAVAELKKVDAAHAIDREVHRLLAEAYEKLGAGEKARAEYILAGVTPKEVPVPTAPAVSEGVGAGDNAAGSEGEDDGATAAELQKEGDTYRAAGKDDEAIATYQEAIRFKGENGEIYDNLAQLYVKKGLLDEAVVAYRQSLKFIPDSNGTRQRLAEIYASRGSFPQAVEQYREMVKREPKNAALHLRLAKALISTKNLKEAAAECSETIRLDPDNLDAHRELAPLYKKANQTDEAVKQYREVLRLKKDDVDARNALTAIYVKNKSYDELVELLKESVELNPQDPNGHYKLGLVFEFKKDYEAAIARYKEAIGLKSDHAKSLNALGRVYLKTGHIDEAREALEAAKKADPSLEETSVLLNNIKDEFYPETKGGKYYNKKAKKSKKAKKGKKSKKKKTKKATKNSGSKE